MVKNYILYNKAPFATYVPIPTVDTYLHAT